MPQRQSVDNKAFANLIISRKMATLEQIRGLWPYCTPQKDIGMLCVEQGLFPPVIYQKMVEFMSMRQNSGVQNTALPKQAPETKKPVVQPSAAKQPAPPPVSKAEHMPPQSGEISDVYTGVSSELPPVQSVDSLQGVFRYARRVGASDVHVSVNSSLVVRRFGALIKVSESLLSKDMTEKLIRTVLTPEQLQTFEQRGDLEFVYDLSGAGRYRVTVMRQRAGWDLTARCIPDVIRPFETTGMPESCRVLTQWAQGLVLVTGPACCGKSSTLNTLVEMVNQSRYDHIITLESPIEYIYTSAHAQITQRQIGKDTASQDAALRAALREDPDIIVIGELRDLDTIRLAVSAAETGHLVFSTMNTISASRTIYRLIDSFPPEEQGIMRNMISESLRGVISQQLIPQADGCGMVAAFEVLLVNNAVANMIRKDETHQLGTAMITGKAAGMQLLDDSLKSLAAQGLITEDEVAARSMARISLK